MPPKKVLFLESISCILVTSTGYLNDNFHVVFMQTSWLLATNTELKEWISSVNVQPPNHQNNGIRPTLIATLWCLGDVKSKKSISVE